MTKVISFMDMLQVEAKVGFVGMSTKLKAIIPITEAEELLWAYVSVRRSNAPLAVMEELFKGLLEADKKEIEIFPREKGNTLFLERAKPFIGEGFKVVGPLALLKYSWRGRDYLVSKTPMEYAKNIENAYLNTKNPQICKKLEKWVWGYEFGEDATYKWEEKIYYHQGELGDALRKLASKNHSIQKVEHNPFYGMNTYVEPNATEEEKALAKENEWRRALLEAQIEDGDARVWVELEMKALEELVERMKKEPEEVFEIIQETAKTLKDMFPEKIQVSEGVKKEKKKGKNPEKDLEDPYFAEGVYTPYENHRKIVAPRKYADPRYKYRKEALRLARRANAHELVEMLEGWELPKKARGKEDQEEMTLAEKIGFSEACNWWFQTRFGDEWINEMVEFLAYSDTNRSKEEGFEILYVESKKVLEELAKGKTLTQSLGRSVYKDFRNAKEAIEFEEIKEENILKWLGKTGTEKYEYFKKYEGEYLKAKMNHLEIYSKDLEVQQEKALEQKEAGLDVCDEYFKSLEDQQENISKKLEKLGDQLLKLSKVKVEA